MRNTRLTAAMLVTILLVIALAVWLRQCMAVDTCLDSGGAWDRARGLCVREAPPVPAR